jgi:hypothetical protein
MGAQGDQAIKLKVEKVDNPLPLAMLGDIGLVTKVEGTAELSRTVLIQPFHKQVPGSVLAKDC